MEFDQFLSNIVSTMLAAGGMLLVMGSPLIAIFTITRLHNWFGRRRRVR